MTQLDEIQKRLLREVADLHEVPEGAYNIRSNSQYYLFVSNTMFIL